MKGTATGKLLGFKKFKSDKLKRNSQKEQLQGHLFIGL